MPIAARWQARVTDALAAWNRRDDGLSPRRRAVALVLVSALGLYVELVLIRLLGSEIKVFAFLKNVVLLAAFLGLGLGFFLARRRVGLLPLFLPGLAVLGATVALGARSGLLTRIILPGDDLVLVGLVGLPKLDSVSAFIRLLASIPYYGITLLYFVFVVLVFLPLGEYTGKSMGYFPALRAYSMNLAGALVGTVGFALVSFAWLPPFAWFAIAAVLALPLVGLGARSFLLANLGAAIVLVGLQGPPARDTLWSPYNRLGVSMLEAEASDGRRVPWGYQLRVGRFYYQDIFDLSDAFLASLAGAPLYLRYMQYEVPYAYTRPRSVLVLGAGGGNDVAAALRRGAEQVDAVDIDPGILAFGKRLHPEQPYASPRVTLHATDARAYLKNTGNSYDLVLFGLLDSQQVLSAFGSVRLDNFVYTVEGMREAFSRVNPGGLLVVTFELFQPWVGERIGRILEEATGQAPTALNAHHGTVFLVRKGAPLSESEIEHGLAALGGVVKPLALGRETVAPTTDDWPYLYLRDRGLPFAYWTMLPLVALLGLGVSRQVLGTGWGVQGRFFWLGAAFMLMEVRIIAEVALLFGSTWLVNAAAIAAVLVMAVGANTVVAKYRIARIAPFAVLLLLALGATALLRPASFLGLGQVPGGALASLFLAAPIFFAGMVFSGSLRRAPEVAPAMASNLLGAILGGLVEYASLVLGIGSLAWLAAVGYLLALLSPVAGEGRLRAPWFGPRPQTG